MKESELKDGMKVRLINSGQYFPLVVNKVYVLKKRDGWIKEFKICETNGEETHYCIPLGWENEYSDCFKRVVNSLRTFIED